MTCSKKMREILLDCRMYVSPTHVVEVVDKLIASQKIIEAERLIRLYIARFPNKKTPVILLNRYILIIHADLWISKKYGPTRKELFDHFKEKSLTELKMSVQRSGNPTESTTFQEMLCGIGSVMKKHNPCPIGNKFKDNVFPPTQYAEIRRICNEEEIYDPPMNSFSTVSGEATCILAYICFKNRDYINAVKLIEKAAEYDPNAVLYFWFNGVLQHYIYQNFEASCHAYTCAIKVAPDFAYSYYSLGVLASDSGDIEKSEFLYQQCLKLDPCHHYALLNSLVRRDEDDPDVLVQYQKIMEFHPSELIANRAIARILLRNPTPQNIEEAEIVLREAIKIDEGACDGFIWYDLGFFFREHKIDIKESNIYFNNFLRTSNNKEFKDGVKYMMELSIVENSDTDEEYDTDEEGF